MPTSIGSGWISSARPCAWQFRGLCALAICAAGSILFAGAQVVPLFPEYPPTPDTDPGTRHQVEVSMPTRLSVQRAAGRLSVSYDLASLRNVKITVGNKMTIGMRDELRVYLRGEARPLRCRNILEGSINENAPTIPLSDPNLLKSTETLTSVQDGIPAAGKRYTVEHDIILFETDVPAQHMWSPESSGNYRVLLEKRLNAVR
jgi:hypothetical protein